MAVRSACPLAAVVQEEHQAGEEQLVLVDVLAIAIVSARNRALLPHPSPMRRRGVETRNGVPQPLARIPGDHDQAQQDQEALLMDLGPHQSLPMVDLVTGDLIPVVDVSRVDLEVLALRRASRVAWSTERWRVEHH